MVQFPLGSLDRSSQPTPYFLPSLLMQRHEEHTVVGGCLVFQFNGLTAVDLGGIKSSLWNKTSRPAEHKIMGIPFPFPPSLWGPVTPYYRRHGTIYPTLAQSTCSLLESLARPSRARRCQLAGTVTASSKDHSAIQQATTLQGGGGQNMVDQ